MKVIANEEGFTAVEGVIIVLLVVVIGGVGFLGYQNYTKSKAGVKSDAVMTSESPAASTSTKSRMLKITEFGLEITLPDSLKDLSYDRLDGAADIPFYGFTSTAALATDANCTASAGALGSIHVQVTGTDQGIGTTTDEYKLSNGTSLFYTHPQSYCIDPDGKMSASAVAAKQKVLSDQVELVAEAVKTAKLVK